MGELPVQWELRWVPVVSQGSNRGERQRLAAELRGEGRTWAEIAVVMQQRHWVSGRAAMRIAHSWTQQQAANEWNRRWPDQPKEAKNFSYWERWPHSGRPPTLPDLARLAELYQCSAGDLLGDVDYSGLDPVAMASRISGRGSVRPPATAPTRLEQVRDLADPAGLRPVRGQVGLTTSPGRFFPGVAISAQVCPAVADSRVLVSVRALPAEPLRGLLLGADVDTGRVVAMDLARARQRSASLPPDAALIVPAAYEVDDLTIGIIWAIANLDEALLANDAALTASRPHLAADDNTTASKVRRDAVENLSPVARMWLGSEFCARHILRNVDQLDVPPTFWTQERRGEDGSTWLLFAHKLAYLQALANRFGHRHLTRAFCVPNSTIADSPPWERVVFLLAAALIESFDIEVVVCPDPEYTSVEGVVLERGRQAIVASWVGVESLWHVDVTRARPVVREFGDASGYAQAHSATAAPTSVRRLRALAEYLDVDWAWLHGRCAGLADYGSAGLLQPRSRLLSTAGVDRACQFVAGLRDAA